MCKHWNGSIGSTTIQLKPGNVFTYEHSEKQSCFKKGIVTPSFRTCSYFEARY